MQYGIVPAMQMNKWLERIILVGLFVLPFLPFLVPYSMFFPFITGKNFLFRFLIEILFACWLILVVRNRAYMPRRSAVLLASGGFLVVLALADLFGANPSRSFWSNYERMEGLVTHLHLFAYFLVIGSVLGTAQVRARREQLWSWLLHTSIGASLLMCCYALFQLGGAITINQGATRVDGTLGNAAYMAIYLVFHIFLLAYFLLKRGLTTGARVAYGVAIAFEAIILYYTATRGALVGIVLGAIVAAVLYLFQKERTKLGTRVAQGIIGLVLVAVLLFAGLQKTSFVQSSDVLRRFTPKSLLDSVLTRSTIWSMAYQGWQENPVLGWGQDNFNLIFNKYYTPSLYGQEPWFDRAHNVFFDWLTAAGLLGLLTYLALYGAGIWAVWKAKSEAIGAGRVAFIGLFVAYFVHNFTVFDNVISYILFFTVLAYMHTLHHGDGVVREESPSMAANTQYAATAAIVLLMVGVMYYINWPAYAANKTLLQALDQRNSPEMRLASFEQAIAYESFGTPEAREQLVQAAVRELGGDKATEPVKQEFGALAERELQSQIALVPDDARYRVFLGSFYSSLGQYDAALTELQKAHELSPGKQTILMEIGSVYLNKKQYPEAISNMRQAYELDRSFERAVFGYAATLIIADQMATADAILAERFGTTTPTDGLLVNAYAMAKRYDRLVTLWKAKIAEDPTNGQSYVSLAASYLALGERTQAIVQLEKAIEVNPQFKEQGEYFIKEIRAGRNP